MRAARPIVALLAVRLLAALAAVAAATFVPAFVEAPSASAATYPAPPVQVYPIPGARVAAPQTQITLRGFPVNTLGPVSVTGSRSGAHQVAVYADSDGEGVSLVPLVLFTPGETVTVRTTLNVVGGSSGSWHFTVATPAGPIYFARRPSAPRRSGDVEHFRSRPDLVPAAVRVLHTSSKAAPGDIFVAPQRGPVQWGPMILGPGGGLVWWDPLPDNLTASDFRVQTYQGQPVLTYWQGQVGGGLGSGQDIVLNSSYQQVATVSGANGVAADLHEFLITPQDTALITGVYPVHYDAGSVGGAKDQDVVDSVVQEIDIPTGLVLYQWDSIDHVPLADSYDRPRHLRPFDYFHVNSVEPDGGDFIISSRNTSAAYKVDAAGTVLWRLGGKQSSFALSGAGKFFYQHDVEVQGSGDQSVTVFNDAGGPPRSAKASTGLKLALDTVRHTARVVAVYRHTPPLVANYEGNLQSLPGGDTFIGWGQAEYFTEFSPGGSTVFDAKFVDNNSSYRAYRFPWTGTPTRGPSAVLVRNADGISTIYASWNGATGVAEWRVLGGPDPSALTPLNIRPRTGFESAVRVGTEDRYLQAQAVDASGRTLASTPVLGGGATRLSVFGHSMFVAPNGVAGVQVGCFAVQACHVGAQLAIAGHAIGPARQATLPPGSGGIVYLRLTNPQLSALLAAGGHQAGYITVRDRSGVATYARTTLKAYRLVGTLPRSTIHQSPSLTLLVHTAFVAGNGTAGLFVNCHAENACQVRTTVSVGGTVVARTKAEQVGAMDGGIVYFSLSPAAQSRLSALHGRALAATVTLHNGQDTVSAEIGLVGPVKT